jgi:iturin family lipopeptide synthetase A
MPLTHDMGLIGFYLMQFANRVHINLMPTELFVRRPLLWLQLASKKRAPSPARRISATGISSRCWATAARGRRPVLDPADLQRRGADLGELCNEFMSALAYTGLKRQAMYPGLRSGGSLAGGHVSGARADYRWIRVNRHKLGVGRAIELNPADARDALELMCVGRRCRTPSCASRTMRAPPCRGPSGTSDRGANVTRGYFGDPGGDGAGHRRRRLARHRRSRRPARGALYITGRSKEIIFVNGQNYYPYDLENIAQRAPGLDLNKVVAAGVAQARRAGRGTGGVRAAPRRHAEFLPTAAAVSRLINEHTGLEVAQVIPVKRIPKTTSGKVQRHLLEQAYVEGEFDAELAELEALRERAGRRAHVSGSDLETRLQAICEAALPGKRIDVTTICSRSAQARSSSSRFTRTSTATFRA